MSNDHEWEFAGIFDDLTPDMFSLDTSAVLEREGIFTGRKAFNLSVDEQIRNIQTAFAASGGKINPLAVLTNATMQRSFTPDRDENLGDFLERLKREARMMSAHWLFIAKESTIGTYDREPDEDYLDIASDEAKSRAGDMRAGILWYAERREGKPHHRIGAMETAGKQVTSVTEGDERQKLTVFSLILDGVTA